MKLRRCLEDVLKMSLRHFCENVLKTSWLYVLKMSWRRLEDVFKTSWRILEDVLKTFLQDVFKTSWRRLLKMYDYNQYIRLDQDILKTSPEDEDGRHLQDAFKTSSLRPIFAGTISEITNRFNYASFLLFLNYIIFL